jgi:hypothetical protein
MKTLKIKTKMQYKSLFKIITLLLFVSITSCYNNSKADTIKVIKNDPNEKLSISIIGLPNVNEYFKREIVAKRWGFTYNLLGCSGDPKYADSLNLKTKKILENRHGKFWKEIFEHEVIEENLNWVFIYNSLKKDKSIINKSNELRKNGDKLNLLICDVNKYDYEVIVLGNDERYKEPVSFFRYSINTKTKKVTLLSNNAKKSSWDEGFFYISF